MRQLAQRSGVRETVAAAVDGWVSNGAKELEVRMRAQGGVLFLRVCLIVELLSLDPAVRVRSLFT